MLYDYVHLTKQYLLKFILFYFILFLNLKHCISFAKHQNESATGIVHQSQKFCWSSHEEIPHAQGKRNPSKKLALREGIRGQTDWNHNQRQLANLITWTTALSNSMKVSHAMWGHPRWTGHGGEVWQNVVHWRREWQTTSVFLPWELHEQYEKAKR